MTNKYVLKNFFSFFFNVAVITLGVLMVLFGGPVQLNAEQAQSEVVEYLKLDVPTKYREAWLNAENESWGPWLRHQKGFIDRKMYWDKDHEQAVLLISWSSRDAWKAIPDEDIERVQKRFEELARLATGEQRGNPFPLDSEGELLPQS